MKKLFFLLFVCIFSCGSFSKTMQNPAYTPAPIEQNTTENAAQAINLEGLTIPAAACDLVYFNQTDPRWADKNYGPQNRMETYGCGPTVLSMLVSTFTDQTIYPDEMAAWCYENGFFSPNSGSYHSIIAEGASAWGLDVKPVTDSSYHSLLHELYSGRLLVFLMGKGHFTESGHFLIVRNVTLEGKLLIADPNSSENTMTPWEYELILSEIKQNSSAGGPIWSIGR